MRECRLVICYLLLAGTVLQGVSSNWLDSVGRELKRFGEKASREIKKAGSDVEAELGRFSDSVGPEVERWGDQASSLGNDVESWFHRSNDDNHHNDNDGVATRIDDVDSVDNKCPPLDDPSMDVSCHLDGNMVNCTEPMPVGATADLKCRVGYVYGFYPGYTSVTCNDTFKWSKPVIKCVPDCGKTNDVGQQLVSGGKVVQVGEFPWHVGIYRLNSINLLEQICGGSLISPSLIVSAAHCFWDHSKNKLMNMTKFKIAVGKYSRDWYTPELETQPRDLSEIIVHERYLGLKRNLAYDIAILRVTTDIVLTKSVNTCCIDWQDNLEDVHLVSGNKGSIAGWGVTENNTASDVSRNVQLPYIPFNTCSDIVAAEFLKYLTHDKLCAGFLDKGISVCPGDSGGGYVFPQTTEKGTRYYLRGIASAGHRPKLNSGDKCHFEQVSGFTLLSTYRRWIEKIVYP